MPIEIERKFLTRHDGWRAHADAGTRMRQGYLPGDGTASVRIRIEGQQALLNIKSATLGMRRQEFEYPIPFSDAEELLDTLCRQPLVEKTRYRLADGAHTWEIDVFSGDNAGLIVAEIELNSEEEAFPHPDWLGEEVTGDTRYYNVCLVSHPYKDW